MPKRREGPVLNKQTGYYFFDSYVGLGAERRRIRVSLHTHDRARATWLWEQEFKRRWSEHYGIKSVKPAAPARFASLIPEFIAFEREVKRAATWKTFEKRLEIVASIWGDITLSSIGPSQLTALDKALRGGGRRQQQKCVTPYTVNHYFGLLKTMFNYAIAKESTRARIPLRTSKPYVVDRKRRTYTPEEIKKRPSGCRPRARDGAPGP